MLIVAFSVIICSLCHSEINLKKITHSEESRGPYKASGRIIHSEESRGLIRQVVV